MKPGDLVRIVKVHRWGGFSETGRRGILVSRTYMAYEDKLSQWEVLVEGEIEVRNQGHLRRFCEPR